MNIKKEIAREGLIFLCVFPVLLLMVAWNNSGEGNSILEYVFFGLMPGYIIYLMIRSQVIGNAAFPATAKYRLLKEVIILGMPIIFVALFSFANREFNTNTYMLGESQWKYISNGIFLAFLIIIPAYIVRFIIWAIKTLRGS